MKKIILSTALLISIPVQTMQLTTLQLSAHQLFEKTPAILHKYKRHIAWGATAFGIGYMAIRLLDREQQKTGITENLKSESQKIASKEHQVMQKPCADESKSEKAIQLEPDWAGINTRMQMINDLLSPAGFKIQTRERPLDGIMLLTTKAGSHWLMLYRYSTQQPDRVRIAKIQWPHLSCMPITFQSMDRELLKQMVPKKQTLNAKSCTFTDEEFMFKVTAKIDKSNVIFNAHHLLKD